MLGTLSGLCRLIYVGMGKWVPSAVTILAPELPNGIIVKGVEKHSDFEDVLPGLSLKPIHLKRLADYTADKHSLEIVELF